MLPQYSAHLPACTHCWLITQQPNSTQPSRPWPATPTPLTNNGHIHATARAVGGRGCLGGCRLRGRRQQQHSCQGVAPSCCTVQRCAAPCIHRHGCLRRCRQQQLSRSSLPRPGRQVQRCPALCIHSHRCLRGCHQQQLSCSSAPRPGRHVQRSAAICIHHYGCVRRRRQQLQSRKWGCQNHVSCNKQTRRSQGAWRQW